MATRKATGSSRSVAGSSKGATKKVAQVAEPKTRKTSASKARSRPTATVRNKTGQRSSASGDAIAATASGPYATSTGRPADHAAELPAGLREYVEAFVAELDNTVVPAIVQRLLAGAALLSPVDLAKRMLAVAPAPAPANKMAEQVGPEFYDTAGVTVVLARPGADPISKQAVEHRRRRRTILALQTSDGRWIYPTWQFRDNDVIPRLAEVLAVFDGHSTWSVGTWLTTPSVDLDGRTAVQWLDEGRDLDHLLRLARHTAHRWAA